MIRLCFAKEDLRQEVEKSVAKETTDGESYHHGQ